jgi:hypothetical protein
MQRRGGQLEDKKYYLEEIEVSQQAYQSYVRGLISEVQAPTDFGERDLSKKYPRGGIFLP